MYSIGRGLRYLSAAVFLLQSCSPTGLQLPPTPVPVLATAPAESMVTFEYAVDRPEARQAYLDDLVENRGPGLVDTIRRINDIDASEKISIWYADDFLRSASPASPGYDRIRAKLESSTDIFDVEYGKSTAYLIVSKSFFDPATELYHVDLQPGSPAERIINGFHGLSEREKVLYVHFIYEFGYYIKQWVTGASNALSEKYGQDPQFSNLVFHLGQYRFFYDNGVDKDESASKITVNMFGLFASVAMSSGNVPDTMLDQMISDTVAQYDLSSSLVDPHLFTVVEGGVKKTQMVLPIENGRARVDIHQRILDHILKNYAPRPLPPLIQPGKQG